MNKLALSTPKTTRRSKKLSTIEPTVEPTVELIVEPTIEPKVEVISFRQRLDNVIQGTIGQINSLKINVQEMKRLQKEHDFLLKEASKKSKKKKGPRDFTKPRRATGFAEPRIVSDELYDFLVKSKATIKDPKFVATSTYEDDNCPRILVIKGTLISLMEVAAHISKYAKEYNLQNPEARTEIIPNSVLSKIFAKPEQPSKRDATKLVHTFNQIQRAVKHHFIKKQV